MNPIVIHPDNTVFADQIAKAFEQRSRSLDNAHLCLVNERMDEVMSALSVPYAFHNRTINSLVHYILKGNESD